MIPVLCLALYCIGLRAALLHLSSPPTPRVSERPMDDRLNPSLTGCL